MSIIIDKNGKRVYKTDGNMSYHDKEIADKLDDFLEVEVPRIEDKMLGLGLLEFKNKPGAIKLWYHVGVELRSLWTKTRNSFGLPDTKLPIFIKAVYDHSNKIRPTSGRSGRFKNAHFYYCYIIAGYSWEKVQAVGNWRTWVEFLDSKRIKNDLRIADWFAAKSFGKPSMEGRYITPKSFRQITRAIRNSLREIDTTVLDDKELYRKLDRIFEEQSLMDADRHAV